MMTFQLMTAAAQVKKITNWSHTLKNAMKKEMNFYELFMKTSVCKIYFFEK